MSKKPLLKEMEGNNINFFLPRDKMSLGTF